MMKERVPAALRGPRPAPKPEAFADHIVLKHVVGCQDGRLFFIATLKAYLSQFLFFLSLHLRFDGSHNLPLDLLNRCPVQHRNLILKPTQESEDMWLSISGSSQPNWQVNTSKQCPELQAVYQL